MASSPYNPASSALFKAFNCVTAPPRKFRRTPLATALLLLTASSLHAQTASEPVSAPSAVRSQETTLPNVIVTDVRDREEKGYQADKSSVSKVPQLLRDIPSSVTVITEQLMHDRNTDTLKEALRNVAGLTFNAAEGGRVGDNFTLRGFSVVSDLYLDGLRDISQYNRDAFNIEQVDVLRGSASMIFGRGSTGGVINQVSKIPMLKDHNEAAVTLGSFNYRRETADLNKVIGDDAAVRLNVMKTDAGSFRTGANTDRLGVAPSIRWGIGTQDEFNVSLYHLEYKDVPDLGIPWFKQRPLEVPIDRFYGFTNYDYVFGRFSVSLNEAYYFGHSIRSADKTNRKNRFCIGCGVDMNDFMPLAIFLTPASNDL